MLNPVIEQQLTMDAPFAWVVWSKGRVSSRYGPIIRAVRMAQ